MRTEIIKCDECIYKEDCEGISISAQMTKEICIGNDYELYEEELVGWTNKVDK